MFKDLQLLCRNPVQESLYSNYSTVMDSQYFAIEMETKEELSMEHLQDTHFMKHRKYSSNAFRTKGPAEENSFLSNENIQLPVGISKSCS